ncbi:hypothetical protein [Beggiatoa leptomitoformis]|uniref:Type II secretion system protein M n=1 Tax=Beggiatoa leptomitoformis TaxID=288004 RepID=A0A2N9YHA4_9GAMM|nr:hypothetical protein [Beggiatoa leptomitoformis]ALG67807.1 hypothetical protein AL038_08945 [Beggiatoa leptomitoformis]AUI69941.1 hypothetical protein BLE401_15365 [Beggiatoa leptomitoformis]
MSTPLVTELQNNIRLRLGLWFILFILSAYGLLLLNDYRYKVMGEYTEANKRLAQLQSITQQQYWLERKQQVQTLRLDTESHLWLANSKGLAQANVQAWLSNQLKVAGIKEPRIKAEAAIDATQTALNLWQVTAQVEAPFSVNSVNTLLLAITQNPQWLIIERFEIRSGQSMRFTLVVTAYFLPSANS